jgi:diguanylate cyclase (GGDEF)-like protein/PAS domain S-box-containing protein
MIGDFTLIMPSNVKFKNDNYVELYTRQVGLLITRSGSEVKLIESEMRLRSVFAAVSDPLFILDQKTGAILDVNNSACSLYGYSRDEMLQLKNTDMSAEPEKTRKALEESSTLVLVRYHKKKDGNVFPVEITTSLLELKDRKVSIASMRDITGRMKAEEALRESEENLQRAQRLAKIGSWKWTIATDIVQWSEELCVINGHDPKLPVPSFSEMSSFYTSEGWERLNEAVTKALNNGESYELDLDLIRTDGTIIKTIARAEVDYDTSGKIASLQGTVQDVTKHKLIEEALRASEEKFAKAFHSSPGAVTITSLDNGKLIEVNKSFTDILGYSHEEAIGHTTLELGIWINQKSRARFTGALEKDGFVHNKELELRNKDGGILTLIVSAELINLAGEAHMLASFYNITERKNAEEKLKNAQLLLKSGIESSKDMLILAIDKNYNYLFFNRAHKDSMLSAYGKEVETGMNILDCITSEVDKINIRINFDRALNGESHSTIQEYGDKKRSYYESFFNPIINENNEIIGITAFARDITERKNKENEILHLSYHDKLTEIYNRRFVEEEIKRLDTRRQLPLSIIMGDLNSLKLTNDTFGHTVGDTMLKETAGLLKKICRSDDILARWGGDEFVILLPKTSMADAEEIVARIKKECSKLIIQKIPIGLAMGIATKTEETWDIDKIIIEAEGNMYKNKLVEKESSASSIIFALEQALFEKSNETLEHAVRIKDNAIKLGKSVKLHSSQLDELTLLASLHDIGKVAIPETILLKKGKPTEEEWTVLKRHPEIGFNIAQSSSQIVHIAKFILACHENWDGSGYPKGLRGDKIPIVSRIIFICDAYDVMTSERSYKKAFSKEEAIKKLRRCAGTQFDPMLIEKFIKIISKSSDKTG